MDNPILETGARVNRKSIYSIYNGEMPEEEDSITDSLAVAQEWECPSEQGPGGEPGNMAEGDTPAQRAKVRDFREGHPNVGKTVVLTSNGSTKQGFAVGSDLEATELTHAQLVRQLECEPDTERRDLPEDTNARVTAAAEAWPTC